eukprot:scaffold76808_cov66-Phaeocystis_antarctica.AAC.6
MAWKGVARAGEVKAMRDPRSMTALQMPGDWERSMGGKDRALDRLRPVPELRCGSSLCGTKAELEEK